MIEERASIEQLTSFLSVAETGSFRKAGARLGVGQSAVSRRIQRLEDLLGVSLFERRPSGARLTAAGTCFAVRARSILDELDASMDTARTSGVAGNGYLRLGVIASLSRGSLRDLLIDFIRAQPGVEVCVVESDRSELLTELSHRRIDIVYAAGEPDEEVGDGFVFSRERIYLAVPEDSPFALSSHVSWQEAAHERFVVTSREPGPEVHDYVIRRVSSLARSPQINRQRVGREGIMSLVGLGMGVSLVADHWRGAQYPNVAFIQIGDDDEHVPFSLTWRPENDNPALRRFISLARIQAKRNGALS